MSLGEIDIEKTLSDVRQEMAREEQLSPTLKALIDVLIVIVTLLSQRLGLNSRNSSKPPSADPYREKASRAKGQRKPGGQPGHEGKTLTTFDEVDTIEEIAIDRRTLPKGQYHDGGYEARQVVDT